jgi:glycosyltransferase involved in cell wall biosynthesis
MPGLFVQKHAVAVNMFHNVSVLYITTDKTLATGKHLITENDFEGVRETKIYFGKSASSFINSINYIRYYLKGMSLVRDRSGIPDLIHVHILSRTAFPALYYKFAYAVPYLITEHWSRYLPVNLSKRTYSGWFRKFFTKIAVKNACGVTTVTNNLAQAMQNLGLHNQYFVTPNVADTEMFYPDKNKKDFQIKKLVHVSCFDEPAKNICGIINTIKKLSEIRNDFVLEIIGDGPDYKQVYRYASDSGLLNSKIKMTGLLTGEELYSKMREADLFIMFSNYENFPCTIAESLSSGVPVISTDVGGIKEFLKPEHGVLIPSGDEKELLDSINHILDHPERFNTTEIREYALSTFSNEKVGKLFSDIYIRCGLNKTDVF